MELGPIGKNLKRFEKRFLKKVDEIAATGAPVICLQDELHTLRTEDEPVETMEKLTVSEDLFEIQISQLIDQLPNTKRENDRNSYIREPTAAAVTTVCNTDVDFIVIIDHSGSVTDEFRAQKQLAYDAVSQLTTDDFAGRVSFGLITFGRDSNVVLNLKNGYEQEDVLTTIEGIESQGGKS